MSEMLTSMAITDAEAEALAKNPGGRREDDPPFLRFVETTVEDRDESLKMGRLIHLRVVKVYIRARGDNKCEVPDIVEGWSFESKMVPEEITKTIYRNEVDADGNVRQVEKQITEVVEKEYKHRVKSTPWLDKLRERLHHGLISKHYHDYCLDAYKRWKNNQEAPVDGIPVTGWNQISMAMQKNLMEMGINSIEKVAEMSEDAIAALGMGSREAKRLAQAYIATTDKGAASAEMAKLTQENQRMETEMSALRAKFADLEERQRKESTPKRGRPRKNADESVNTD